MTACAAPLPPSDRITAMAGHGSEISEDTFSALKALVGRHVYTVYAPVLAVAGTHVAAPSFAISLSDQVGDQWVHSFLNLKATWSETPRFLNDSWELQAFEARSPLGIEVNAENAMMSPCSVHFYENGGSEVINIRVYSLSLLDQDDPSESVVFDKALELMRANGTSFCIACQLNGPGIAEDVHLTEDPVVIKTLTDACQIRLTFP
jgi:hypothetical protein